MNARVVSAPVRTGAVDLGFGWVKAAMEGGKVLRIPSVIGEPRNIYEEDVRRQDLRYCLDNEKSGSIETRYFVGDLALRHSDIKYAGTGKDKSRAFTTRILLETCLGYLAAEESVNLVTGLPLDFYNTQKKDMEELLRDFNSGPIYRIQEGRQGPRMARPAINQFKIVPQHLGAAMNHFLDESGQEKNAGECMKTWLVIDPGRYTLGLLGLEKMQIMKESSSPAMGVEVAYKIIQDELKEQLGRTPDRFLLDSYILDGEYDGIDLVPLTDYAFKAWASQIQLEIESFNRDFHGYIITGGWADRVSKNLRLPKDKTFVLDQWGNLKGYLKIGKRTWPGI